MKMIASLSIALFALSGCAEESAQKAPENFDPGSPADYADYVVIGKSINTRQEHNGAKHLLNTVFFAEIFQTPLAVEGGGLVTNGYLIGPGEAEKGLRFSDDKLARFLAGKRQMTIPELTENFPDTTYHFNFDTPAGNIRDMPVTFKREGDELLNPDPISIYIHQGGMPADPAAIDPDQDLVVGWDPFVKGSADPNTIIDDMIYAMFGNCMGALTVHSGHAFDPGSLTYIENEFTIPAKALHSGQPFMVEVEHSNMETDIFEDIEIIVTYAASTFLDLQTTGENTENTACPAVPYAFDGGATDRERPPTAE